MRIANDNFVPFLMNFVQICMRVKDLKREGGRGGGMMNIDRSFSERIGSGAIYAAAGKIILLMVMNVLVKMC